MAKKNPQSDNQTSSPGELESLLNMLVEPHEVDFLLREISRANPPTIFKELAGFFERQSLAGGGFFGLLPNPMEDSKELPIPDDETGILAAAVELARQRAVNLEAISDANPDYSFSFRKDTIPDWPGESSANMSLCLDISAIRGYLEFSEGKEVSIEEAVRLVNLPANQEMLKHRLSLSYMPAPYVTESSLAKMIVHAGSADPLDRLWNWVNPMNNFGYADLASKADDYAFLADQLERNGRRLAGKVLSNITKYTPVGTALEETFAFTVGFFIRGWATDRMSGLNIEQVKDNWDFILGTVTEEVYHRYQLKYCPTASGQQALNFEDLASSDLGDIRFDKLYELLTYTVLEGAANLARGENISKDLPEGVNAGLQLLVDFYEQVIQENEIESADTLIAQGLRSNGPLYSLGWHMAGLIEVSNGPMAVGLYQQHGPIPFVVQAREIALENGKQLFPTEVTKGIDQLAMLMA